MIWNIHLLSLNWFLGMLKQEKKSQVYCLNIFSLYFSDVNNLIKAVKLVTKSTRSARTVVWCAVQMLYANCATNNSDSNDNSPSGDWWCNVLNDYIMVIGQSNYPHSFRLSWHWPMLLLEITKFKKDFTDSCAHYEMVY